MAVYSIGQRTSDTTNTDACFDVATSTGCRPRLMELGLAMAAGTASIFGLIRPSAIGTRTSPVAMLPEDPGDPTLTGITLTDSAVAHSVQPTFGSVYLRRYATPATVGAGFVWTFPKGLVIAASGSIVLRNLGTNGVSDVYAVVDQ